jgi:hypothetical protein
MDFYAKIGQRDQDSMTGFTGGLPYNKNCGLIIQFNVKLTFTCSLFSGNTVQFSVAIYNQKMEQGIFPFSDYISYI